MKRIISIVLILIVYIVILFWFLASLPNTKDIYSKRIVDINSYINDNYEDYTLVNENTLNYKAVYSQTDLSLFYHPFPGGDGSIKLGSEGNCALSSCYNSICATINPRSVLEKAVPEEELASDSLIKRQGEIYLPSLYLNIRNIAIKKYDKFEDFHYDELKAIYIEVASSYGEVSYQIHKKLDNNALNEIIKYIDEGFSPILNLYSHPYYKNHAVAVTGYKTYMANDEELTILEIIDGLKNKNNDLNVAYLDFTNIKDNKGKGSVQLFKIKT
jgi:hypothetical protein